MTTSFGATCVELLLKVSVQAAVLAAIVWVLTRLASKAPAAWRNALWLLVVVKFLVPPFAYYPSQLAFWQSPAGHSASAEAQSAAISRAAAPLEREMPAKSAIAVGHQETNSPSPAIGAEPAPLPAKAAAPGAVSRLASAWLAGLVVMLAFLIARFAGQVRLVRRSRPAPSELTNVLRDAAQRLGLKRLPDLRVSTDAATPMLVGCIRPVILLPSNITESCGASELKAILLHELAHVKRRDLAAIWLHQTVQVFFFFHPAAWLAGREIRRERELACDELVLSTSAIPARDYAAGYVSALRLAKGARFLPTSLAMAEPLDMQKSRLNRMLRGAAPRFSRQWIAALALLAAVGLPTFVGCSGSSSAPNEELRQARIMAGLTTVEGPGAVITISDSPSTNRRETDPDVLESYKVHHYDVLQVVNELFSAGAEAVSIDGQRMVAGSAIQGAGPTITVNSVPITVPIEIKAIGEPDVLKAALMQKGGPLDDLFLLDMVSIRKAKSVTVPAYAGRTRSGSARPAAAGQGPVTLVDSKTGNAFIAACKDGDVATVRSQLAGRYGAALCRSIGKNGRPALYIAIENHHSDIAKMLLAKGANPNAGTAAGSTPLMVAASNGMDGIAKLLIKKGANVNAQNKFAQSPLLWATLQGRLSTVKLLVTMCADVRAKLEGGQILHVAAAFGRADVTEYLISKGASVNAKNNRGQTPLAVALREAKRMPDYDGYTKVAAVLRKHGGK